MTAMQEIQQIQGIQTLTGGSKPHLKHLLIIHPRRRLQRLVGVIVEGPRPAHRESQRRSVAQDLVHSGPGGSIGRLHHQPVGVPPVREEWLGIQHQEMPISRHPVHADGHGRREWLTPTTTTTALTNQTKPTLKCELRSHPHGQSMKPTPWLQVGNGERRRLILMQQCRVNQAMGWE